MTLLKRLLTEDKARRVMVCAPTNTAVENVAVRCLQDPDMQPHELLLMGEREKLLTADTLKDIFLETREGRIMDAMKDLSTLKFSFPTWIEALVKGDIEDPLTFCQGLQDASMKLLGWVEAIKNDLGVDLLGQQCQRALVALNQKFEAKKNFPLCIIQDLQALLSGDPSCYVALTEGIRGLRTSSLYGFSEERLLRQCRVLFCTVMIAGRYILKSVPPFDVVIVDEACQVRFSPLCSSIREKE